MLGNLFRDAGIEDLLHVGPAFRADDDHGGVHLVGDVDDSSPCGARELAARLGLNPGWGVRETVAHAAASVLPRPPAALPQTDASLVPPNAYRSRIPSTARVGDVGIEEVSLLVVSSAWVETDAVTLTLTKDEAEALPRAAISPLGPARASERRR